MKEEKALEVIKDATKLLNTLAKYTTCFTAHTREGNKEYYVINGKLGSKEDFEIVNKWIGVKE